MKLQSDFRDYYDSVLGYGQDYPLYRRFMRKRESNYNVPMKILRDKELNYTQGIIGFCGTLYPFLKMSKGVIGSWNPLTKNCYSIEDIDKWVESQYSKKEQEHYLGKPIGFNWQYINDVRFKFEQFFTDAKQWNTKFRNIFQDELTPAFVLNYEGHYQFRKEIITVNPQLKQYEFFRVFDSYQTFQNISMFLGNLAEPRKPIPPISDEIMAEIKGFDKWSFRKPPRGKK